MLKAFVILDDVNKFKDLFDVLKVAKALAEQFLRVKQNVIAARQDIRVVRVWGPDPELKCYVALVEAVERKNEPGVGFHQSQTEHE